MEYVEAKDLKDINYNIKLLIQKFNHEHSNIVKDISKIKKDYIKTKEDISFLKMSFEKFLSHSKGMKTMLRMILAIITIIGTLITVGAIIS